MPVVIHNRFADCGFGSLSEVSAEEDESNVGISRPHGLFQ